MLVSFAWRREKCASESEKGRNKWPPRDISYILEIIFALVRDEKKTYFYGRSTYFMFLQLTASVGQKIANARKKRDNVQKAKAFKFKAIVPREGFIAKHTLEIQLDLVWLYISPSMFWHFSTGYLAFVNHWEKSNCFDFALFLHFKENEIFPTECSISSVCGARLGNRLNGL